MSSIFIFIFKKNDDDDEGDRAKIMMIIPCSATKEREF